MVAKSNITINRLVNEFHAFTGLMPLFDSEYRVALEGFVNYLTSREIRPLEERKREYLAYANLKFRLNADNLKKFYAAAASYKITFNYHQKYQIQRAFDLANRQRLSEILNECQIPLPTRDILLCLFRSVDTQYTLEYIIQECKEPSKLRKEKGERDIRGEIVKSQFSAFLWVSLPEQEMHRYFDTKYVEEEYRESFWEQLHTRSPHLFNRDNALHIIRFNQELFTKIKTLSDLRHSISEQIAALFEHINNYGFLAVIIEPIKFENRQIEWELSADITLFAEKHREMPLKKTYFRWEQVRDETLSYAPVLSSDKSQFDLVNEGFTYRDCFVLGTEPEEIKKLLLIFQKNERDETPIPCPTCRSLNVQGNSYSSLGVRSWECNNVLCPDRSKYNRGKRYSFRALVMQQAIDDDTSAIPVESVRRWNRDVVNGIDDVELSRMLVSHYSMFGDTIHVHNWPKSCVPHQGRKIREHKIELKCAQTPFWDGAFFCRYAVASEKETGSFQNLGDDDFQVFLGDSSEVLRSLPQDTFDGAVTSPPYYNAREYAQWKNMYCYLFDMSNINKEVFRTLKPGSIYLYNVFDYFDNERTIVFSAMGQKRMILSAYTVDLFRRIGFELLGNVVWDKGNIEGKRGFNSGNFSPYYQSPFNCWEHVLIFRKPISASKKFSIARYPLKELKSQILRHSAVIKMVRGENIHGHTAPFPDTIPELLMTSLEPGDIVLDPFGGSLTTGRVAEKYGLRSVCVERSKEYCELGLKMRSRPHEREMDFNEQNQLSLF